MTEGLGNEKVWFLRGVLAALASSGEVVHYNEIRGLCRPTQEQLGAYLGAARDGLRSGEPDACAIVVKENGQPGMGHGSVDAWPMQLRSTHRYWRERRAMDNSKFEEEWSHLPTFPGVSGQRP